MNSVTLCARASADSSRCSPAGTVTGTTYAAWLAAAGRCRSVGSGSSSGAPASARCQ
jgi:hypothetical protein